MEQTTNEFWESFIKEQQWKSFIKEQQEEETLDGSISEYEQDIKKMMIEFAKMHVEQALKEASEKARLARAFDYGSYYEPTAKFKPIDEKVVVKESYGHGDSGYEAVKIDTDSILSSYSLENIK